MFFRKKLTLLSLGKKAVVKMEYDNSQYHEYTCNFGLLKMQRFLLSYIKNDMI
jgi:hypothetical protein